MSTTTTRTGDAANTWTQTTAGETPNSIGFSQNANGSARLEIKLYFSPDMPDDEVAQRLANLVAMARTQLSAQGIPLAGQEGK